MAALFKKNIKMINEHIKNIFKKDELGESSVIQEFRITTAEKIYKTMDCNLTLGNLYQKEVLIQIRDTIFAKLINEEIDVNA